MLASTVVAMFTAFFNIPIDMCFDYLTAPTADSVKMKQADSLLKRTGRRMSNVARRMSAVSADAASALKRNFQMKLGFESREISDSTVTAQGFAATATPIVSNSYQTVAAKREEHRKDMVRMTMIKKMKMLVPESDDEDDEKREESDYDRDQKSPHYRDSVSCN